MSLWPVTIVKDRYGGTYSGAKWLAYNMYRVPEGPLDDDLTCCDYWSDVEAGRVDPVGRGSSPDEALADLKKVIKEAKERRKEDERVARSRR